MVTVKESNATLGFIRPVFFERTGKLREKIVDCTREELIDLNFKHLGIIESIQGWAQDKSEELEKELGWTE